MALIEEYEDIYGKKVNNVIELKIENDATVIAVVDLIQKRKPKDSFAEHLYVATVLNGEEAAHFHPNDYDDLYNYFFDVMKMPKMTKKEKKNRKAI